MKREALAKIAAEMIITYLASGNKVAAKEMAVLCAGVCDALKGFGAPVEPEPEPAYAAAPAPVPVKWKPAIPVRRSIRDDALVCLVCGKERLTLRRHLGVAHSLSPQQYRERFDLWDDYPMDAAAYTRVRSDLAKLRGLGGTIKWKDRPRADPDRRGRKRREVA